MEGREGKIVVHISSRFERSYKKMPTRIQIYFDKFLIRFCENPFAAALKTHKLPGVLSPHYVFCLPDGYRVLFVFENDFVVTLVNIGSHDAYARWERI